MATEKPLAVFYEHPHWFNPLFNELDARERHYVRVNAAEHAFIPAHPPRYAALFNRMSPSAWKRGKSNTIFYTHSYLAHLEEQGIPVINGSRSWAYETSKARQADLFQRLHVRTPRTRVVNHPSQLPAAADGLLFPVVVKPNIGGSGAGIRKFDTYLTLVAAVYEGAIEPGLDGTLLVQEYHWPAYAETASGARRPSIVRVETLGGKYLYGIRIFLEPNAGFDLCPADVCRTTAGESLSSSACPIESQKSGMSVEAYTPPAEVISTIERVAQGAHLDVGGIEYLESERDGEVYYYDINALSNFVADPLRVIGFDPTARLVDFLDQRIGSARRAA